MKKIAFMCDSGADVTLQEEKELGIHVIRLPIFVEEKEYKEAVDLDEKQLAKMLDEKKVAKTSQPSPGQFVEFFSSLLKEYDEIFYIPVSHSLSGTYSVAKHLADTEFVGKVTVVKSRFASRPIISLLKDARTLFEKGYTASEVAEKIEQAEINVLILPFDLHTLKRGGRISPAIVAFAGLLKIQVLLEFNNTGVIEKIDKTRTLAKAHTLLVDTAIVNNPQDYHWGVLHSSDFETAQFIQKQLSNRLEVDVVIEDILAIVRAHTGNKTIGIYRISKIEE